MFDAACAYGSGDPRVCLEDIPRYSQPLNVSCRYDSGSDECSGSAYPWHQGANVNNNQAPLGGEYGGAWLRNRDV